MDEAALTAQRGDSGRAGPSHRAARCCWRKRRSATTILYPLLAPHLAGTEASGLFEARLGAEEMPGKEVHVFLRGLPRRTKWTSCCGMPTISSSTRRAQLAKVRRPRPKRRAKAWVCASIPECSTQDGHAIYDPCAPGSRLGTTRAQWDAAACKKTLHLPGLLDGLHFHTLCEQDADALATTLGRSG